MDHTVSAMIIEEVVESSFIFLIHRQIFKADYQIHAVTDDVKPRCQKQLKYKFKPLLYTLTLHLNALLSDNIKNNN